MKTNKIKFYAGWFFMMLPCILVYYAMYPFVYLQNITSEISFKVDDYLITLYNPTQYINNKKIQIKNKKIKIKQK